MPSPGQSVKAVINKNGSPRSRLGATIPGTHRRAETRSGTLLRLEFCLEEYLASNGNQNMRYLRKRDKAKTDSPLQHFQAFNQTQLKNFSSLMWFLYLVNFSEFWSNETCPIIPWTRIKFKYLWDLVTRVHRSATCYAKKLILAVNYPHLRGSQTLAFLTRGSQNWVQSPLSILPTVLSNLA